MARLTDSGILMITQKENLQFHVNINGTEFYLRAKAAADKDQWIESLNKISEELKEKMTQTKAAVVSATSEVVVS